MKIEMKKNVNKKVIWVSAIVALGAVSTVAGIWLYRQLKKMEDYGLSLSVKYQQPSLFSTYT